MIYKTRTKYYRFERKLDEIVLIEMRGNKIVVNNRTFYVDKDFNITEEITGLQVQSDAETRKKFGYKFMISTLEDVEKYIEFIYERIIEVVDLRIKDGYTIQNILNKFKKQGR